VTTTIKQLIEAAEKKTSRVVELTSDLVKFNTTSPNPGQAPVDDKNCQGYIAERLRSLGFQVDLWEPNLEKLSHYPFYIKEQSFRNRPILAARLKGAGGGHSMILNAHLDVVPAGDPALWKHKPWGGAIVAGRVFGRGSCDMKGGAAAIITTAEILNELGIQLQGDLIIETVLDEEINGMGTVACIERGYTADAAIIPEPSNLDLWIATRGLLWARATIEGRSGHAELNHPHWTEGGAVNPIDKASIVLESFRKLENEWLRRSNKKHALLSTPRIIPTIIRSGDFWATIPDRCQMEMDIQYLPADRDTDGYGSSVKKEIEEHLLRSSNGDSWLAQRHPVIEWLMDLPPMEVQREHPLVRSVLSAVEATSLKPNISALDSWDDGAHLMNLASVPSVSIGPGPTEQAHVVDEFVTIDTLSKTTKILCAAVTEWCGIARK
jgi:acetylornithine deacetylase